MSGRVMRYADMRGADGNRPLCRSCGKNFVCRPKGLCFSCSANPDVRNLHPPLDSKFNRRGAPNFCGAAPPPDLPTDAPPGSEDKLAVLEGRAARGEQLWHPLDAGYESTAVELTAGGRAGGWHGPSRRKGDANAEVA